MARLKNFFLGIGVSGVILILVETVMRAVLGPPPPAVAVHQTRAEHEQYLDGVGDEIHAIYQDFRPVYPFPASVDGPRVAFLGGSSVHGGSLPVPNRREFPQLIGDSLGVDVLNLGSPGLDSHDLAQITVELIPWKPDLVVIYTGHNDMANAWFQERYNGSHGTVLAGVRHFLEHFQVFCQLRRTLTGPDGLPLQRGKRPGSVERAEMSDPRRTAAVRALEANLQGMIWRLQEASIPVVLVVPVSNVFSRPVDQSCEITPCSRLLHHQAQSLLVDDSPEASSLLIQARDLDPIPFRATTETTQAIRDLGRQLGVRLVDAPTRLPQHHTLSLPAPNLFLDVVHFSNLGHREMAALLEPVIEEELDH